MFENHRILYPTDFSAGSAAAFRLACSLARDQKAQLIVLHVAAPPLTFDEIAASREVGYRDPIRQELHRIRPDDPTITITHLLNEGDPAAVIVDAAETQNCDLIVMGTHGRTGLSRLLMGSVAENVLRKATVPVLTVKAHVESAEPFPAELAVASGR
jgi:nucleotide-binding universal stress UspA family protein